jgi:FixJ family two-component response regulator
MMGRFDLGKSILVIDDEEMIRESIEIIFGDMGHEVTSFSDSTAGLAKALEHPFDLVIVDVRMPGKNGAEVAEELLKNNPAARLLVITGFAADPLAVRALKAGAIGLLKKPFEMLKILDYLKD